MSIFLKTFVENKTFLDFDTVLPCSKNDGVTKDNLSGVMFKKISTPENSVYFDFKLKRFTKPDGVRPFTGFIINLVRNETFTSRNVLKTVKEHPQLSLKILVCQYENLFCFFYDGVTKVCYVFKLFRDSGVTSSEGNLELLNWNFQINPDYTMIYGD